MSKSIFSKMMVGITLLAAVLYYSCTPKLSNIAPIEPPKPVENTPTAYTPFPEGTYSVYANAKYDFTIRYPKDWVYEEDVKGMAVLFMATPAPIDYDVTVSVIADKRSVFKDALLEDYLKQSVLAAETKYIGFKELERTKIYLGSGIPAYLVIATLPFEYDVGKTYPLKDTFVWFIHGDTGYLVTCDTTESYFDTYDSIFRSMLVSFKILGE